MLSREDNSLFPVSLETATARLAGLRLSEDSFVTAVSPALALASTVWPTPGHTDPSGHVVDRARFPRSKAI